MKKHKKILAVSLPVLLLFSLVSLLMPTKAEAYVATNAAQIQNANFEFVNRGLIKVKIGDKTINFIDTKPFDRGLKYVAQDYECESYIGGDEGMDQLFALDRLGNYPGSLSPEYIHIKYNDNKGNGCQEAKLSKSPGGVDVGMRTWFNWVDAGSIEIIDGSRLFRTNDSVNYFLYTGEGGQNCQDRVFVDTSTKRDPGDNTPTTTFTNNAKYFELDKDGELKPNDTAARSLPLGDCEITGYNFLDSVATVNGFNQLFSHQFRIGEEQNKSKPAGTGQASGGAGSPNQPANSEDACALKGFTLNWVFCPMIYAVDEGFNEINEFVEGQLNYDSDKYLTSDVKRTWSIVRVLATSLLVIIMLVMVISQAIGAGVFDAYTVRKILPRLVVAAIIIQLSWPMAEWIITLANNAGRGIYDLLATPFGGPEKLELEQLIGKLGSFAPTTTVVTAMLTAVGILFFNPFGVLLFAFSILLAVLVAAATLLFRNILILACVILAPLALIAWILPGTKKYWSLWADNFSKALLLFPIIMAMIVIGRIFAYIVASTESGIFDWLAVLVGFFGPYFLLPKAFKWGGSLMATVGNQLNSAGDNFGKKPREFLKGRQEGYQAMKLARSQERVARGEDKFLRKSPASWIRNPIDKMRSGKWDPTLGLPNSSRRERSIASYVSKGLASEAEDIKVERDSLKREWEALIEGDGITKDDYLQDIVRNRISINPETGKDRVYKTVDGRELDPRGRKGTAKRAALEDMGMLAGATNYRHIEEMYQSVNKLQDLAKTGNISPEQREFVDMFTRFKNDNVSNLMPKMTHMYKGVMSTADAGPQGVAGQHGTEVESMLGSLSGRIKNAKSGSDRASAVQALNNYLSAYLQAAENDNLRGSMELGGTRAVKAFITKNSDLQNQLLFDEKTGINVGEDGRVTLGLPQIDPSVADAVDLNTRSRLDALIKDDKGGGFKTGRELQAVDPGTAAGSAPAQPQPAQQPQTSSATTGGVLNIGGGQARAPVAGTGAETQAPQVVVNLDHEELGRTIGRHVGTAVGDVIAPLHEAIKDSSQQRAASPPPPSINPEDEETPPKT